MTNAIMSTTKELAIKGTPKDYKDYIASLPELPQEEAFLQIGSCMLIAGFLKATHFIPFINERIGKKDQCKIDRGEALACLLLLICDGNYASLHAVPEALQGKAVLPLLELDSSITIDNFNRAVFADALEAVFSYGSSKLFSEFEGHVRSLELTKLSADLSVRLDTTNLFKIGAPTVVNNVISTGIEQIDEDTFRFHQRRDLGYKDETLDGVIACASAQKSGALQEQPTPANVTDGLSEDHKPGTPQMLIGEAVTTDGLPALFKVLEDNQSDKVNFPTLIEEILTSVEECLPAFKYIVGNSTLCTQSAFDAAQSKKLDIITLVPNSSTLVKDVVAHTSGDTFQEVCSQKQWSATYANAKEKDVPQANVIEGLELYGHKVTGCLVVDKSKKASKTKTIDKKAQKEVASLTKKLAQKKFKCAADAQLAYNEFVEKAAYCRLSDFAVEPILKDKKRGQGTKGCETEQEVSHYVLQVSCTLDEDKVQQAIENECKYLLVTTDTERPWTALEMILQYRNKACIEKIWTELQHQKLYFSGFLLQKTERVEGLLWLVTVAVFARRLMQKMLTDAIQDQRLQLPNGYHGWNTNKAKMEYIEAYFNCLCVSYVPGVRPVFSGFSKFTLKLLECLGESWTYFLNPLLYIGYQDWPAYGMEDIQDNSLLV